MTSMTRRSALMMTVAAVAIGPVDALAIGEDVAKSWVERTIEELKALLRVSGTAASRAPRLRQIMEARANMPLIAKFSAGRTWKEMSAAQQKRFTDAFSHYVAITYSRRFDEYAGDPQIDVSRTRDAGRRGVLVETPIRLPQGDPILVEWLVSDRGGSVQIVDLVIEGVSMAVTQREEIAAMVQRRQGNLDQLISDLAEAS